LFWVLLLLAGCLLWSCILFGRDLRDEFRVEVGLLVSLLALFGYVIYYAYNLHMPWLRSVASPLDHLGGDAAFPSSYGLAFALMPVYVVKAGIYLRARQRQWQVKEYVAVFLAIATFELVIGFIVAGLWNIAWYTSIILWLGLLVILLLRLVKLPEELAELAAIVSRHFGVAVSERLKHFFSVLTKTLTLIAFWRFIPSLESIIERRREKLHGAQVKAADRAIRDDEAYARFTQRLTPDEATTGHRIRSHKKPPPRRS
jgi:hypothetical protein